MRVVISVGGSVLAPTAEDDRVAAYAEAIRQLIDAGHEVGIVVGGGSIARDYIDAGRTVGASEIALDEIGIGVTRLNARLLIAALGDLVPAEPVETYAAARSALGAYDGVVMGGTSPGHTTDAVAAALAERLDAELLVLATSVPGVFDTDPNTDDTATRYDELTPAELVTVVGALEMNAGSPAPVDLLAAKLLERARLRALVIDGTDPQRVVDAVLDDTFDGTHVLPPGQQ